MTNRINSYEFRACAWEPGTDKYVTVCFPQESNHEISKQLEGLNDFVWVDYRSNDEQIEMTFSEYETPEFINEVIQHVNDGIDEFGLDTIEAISEYEMIRCDTDFENYYFIPDIKDDYDLGYYWIEESGCYDLSNIGMIARYIDYEGFGRDVKIEESGYYTSNGYIYSC